MSEEYTPLQVNIAFQGGGAKLAALLECASQIKTLQEEGKIIINSLSGTSAGSIVAALLACNANFDMAKERIPTLFDTLNHELKIKKRFFSKRLGILKNIFDGKEVFSSGALKSFLDGLFRDYLDGAATFKSLDTPLSIIVTDLSTRSKKTFSKDKTPYDKVIEAISASCSLPFIFHSYDKDTYYVDGGLCENLPVEEFAVESNIYNIAVGFDDEVDKTFQRFEGPEDYFERVVSSSVNHGVRRSENSSNCHEIIRLSPLVNTLDFELAITKMNEGAWRSECQLFLLKVISTLEKRRADEVSVKRRENEQKTKLESMREDLYDSLSVLEHHNVKYLKKEISVVPYCLFESDDERNLNADRVKQIELIKPLSPLRCYHFQLAIDVDNIQRYQVIIEKLSDKSLIPHRVFEVERTDTAVIENGLLTTLFFFFDDYIEENQEYRVSVTYSIFNSMKPLLSENGSDCMVTMNDRRKDAYFEQSTMVFFVPPDKSGRFRMTHDIDKHDVERGLEPIEGKLVDSSGIETPFPRDEGIEEALAWRCKNLGYNQSCCVRIHQN